MGMADDGGAQRLQMINGQLRTSDVNDLDLLAAFDAAPREAFVAPGQEPRAYAESDVASSWPKGRKLLAPRTLGLLLKCANPRAGERALVVGGGSGYCAAVLAAMKLTVVALETEEGQPIPGALVRCVAGDLTAPPEGERFDVIVLNGAFEVVPDRLIAALSDRGRFVGVDARGGSKRVTVFERSGGGVSERAAYDAGADVLPGFARAASFTF